MNNQECKVKKVLMLIVMSLCLFRFTIKTSKCSSICINMCVLDVVKNSNAKVVNLISWTNETRHAECMELVDVNGC